MQRAAAAAHVEDETMGGFGAARPAASTPARATMEVTKGNIENEFVGWWSRDVMMLQEMFYSVYWYPAMWCSLPCAVMPLCSAGATGRQSDERAG